MFRSCLVFLILSLISNTQYAQDQLGKLSVNLGYSSEFPTIVNETGMKIKNHEHDFLFNLTYTSQLLGPLDYSFGKGIVRYDRNNMFPVNSVSNTIMNDDRLSRNEIHINYVVQGNAGLHYRIPVQYKGFSFNTGLLGTYDISLRKETDPDGVNFAMKQYFLKFSRAEIYSVVEVRKERFSVNLGYRVMKVRLFSDALSGSADGAHFNNPVKFRLAVGYHFKTSELMRGTLNFPDIDPDEM